MVNWRHSFLVATIAVLICLGTGCAPTSSSVVNEEKELNVQKGMSRESAMDYSGAIESFQRALEVNPNSSIAHFRLAFLYVRQNNDPAAAIYHFQQYLKLRPNSEHANVIQQHIIGCKQELAKEFAIGPMADEIKLQLDKLIQENQRLKAENQRLEQENRRLRDQLNRLQPGLGGTDSPTLLPQNRGGSPSSEQGSVSPSSTVRTHTVQSGDTYYSIAKRYGIKSSSLQAANPGIDPNSLKIGQKLTVPAP